MERFDAKEYEAALDLMGLSEYIDAWGSEDKLREEIYGRLDKDFDNEELAYLDHHLQDYIDHLEAKACDFEDEMTYDFNLRL